MKLFRMTKLQKKFPYKQKNSKIKKIFQNKILVQIKLQSFYQFI